MIFLFTSKSCSTCKKVIRDIPSSWTSQIMVLRVEFSEADKYYKVYDGDNPLEGKAPVDAVPTLWLPETKEAYKGYSEIMTRLSNVSR